MLSVGRPDNTPVHISFSISIRLTRSANYMKCNKKTCLSYTKFQKLFGSNDTFFDKKSNKNFINVKIFMT